MTKLKFLRECCEFWSQLGLEDLERAAWLHAHNGTDFYSEQAVKSFRRAAHFALLLGVGCEKGERNETAK